MRKIWLGVLALGLSAVPVLAQEKETDQEPRDERPHIQVLKHPYDIASFYRSSEGARGFSYGFGYSDPYGSRGYVNDSGLPPAWYRPDLRGFGERWDDGWRWDARNNRWSFDRRRPDSGPRPAPSRR